ncbi:MAG: ATP-binding protein [Desulfobulbus sp.]
MMNNNALISSYVQAPSLERECECRSAFLPQDVRTFSVLLGLGLLINLLLALSDFLLLNGRSPFPWVLGLRLFFFLFSLITLTAVRRLHDPELYDRWALAWAVACSFFVPLVHFSRPASYTGHISLDLCVVLALYIIQPGPVPWRVLPPIVFSLGNLLLFLTVQPSPYSLVPSLIGYAYTNVLSWLVSANWFRYRRSSFMARKALERLCRDSEQRRRQSEASERTWGRIIDASPNMLVVIDGQQRITRVNKALADKVGMTREAIFGRKCCELLCGVTEPGKPCPHRGICTSKTARSLEAFLPALGIDARLFSAPLIDQGEDGTATALIICDISDWKRTELALKTAQKQYRSLVENSHGIIYTITPQGYITYVSPSYFNLLGFEPEQIVGKHFGEIVHPDDVHLCVAFQEEVLRIGKVHHGLEYRIFHKDGSMRWHLSNFIPRLDGQGRLESFVGNAMDITKQKQHQAELKAAREAAEEANRLKSDFLALVSHEIRTPLNAIVGFSGLARRTTDTVQLRQYIDILDQSAHLLMALVNDILDMSKVELGQLTIDSIPFNLPETLELLRWQFNPVVAKKTGLELSVEMEPNLPAWVVGDPTRLRQVLSNLLSNALKFTETGSVRLRVKGGASEGSLEQCQLTFAVVDTGIGIDLSKQELLFQPFQQIEPGIARKYGGTGLGLAIVRRLVDLMGGHIEVQSRLGKGSCFTVVLPFIPCAPPQYEQIADTSRRPLAVLVVEDNRYNRLLLEETLSEWGHRVSSVEKAADALHMVENRHFDCIIVDLWMPGMDGLELASRLREFESLSFREPVPIIAYTADTDERTRRRAVEAGIRAFLCKPLDPRQLRLILSKHCRPSPPADSGLEKIAAPVIEPIHQGLDPKVIADMGHDPERIVTYAQLLWNDIESELPRLEWAVQVEDRRRIFEASHSLKGLCAYLEDKSAATLAMQLHKGAMHLSSTELKDLARNFRRAVVRPAATGKNEL